MPLLTPAQWKKSPARKPGWTYQRYANWVRKTRAGRAQARRSDPLGTLTSMLMGQMQTPAQARAAAAAQVKAQIEGAIAPIRAQTEAEQKGMNRQAERAQQFALALGQLRSQDAGQAMAPYREAADRLRAYGTGLTGQLAETQQAAAAETAARVAQATGGLGTPPASQASSLRNALQYMGVVSPGTSLEEQAVSAGQGALGEADLRTAQVGGIAQQYLAKSREAQDALNAQIAALRGRQPEFFQEALQAQKELQLQQMATLMSALGLQGETANKAMQAAIDKYNAETRRTEVNRPPGVNPDGSPAPGYYRDGPNGPVRKIPGGMMIDPKNPYRVIPTPSKPGAGQGAAGKAPKLSDWAAFRTNALEGARERLRLTGERDAFGRLRVKPYRWSKAQISNYLMQNFGRDFITTYGRKSEVQQRIATLADQLWKEIQVAHGLPTTGKKPTATKPGPRRGGR